MSTVKKWVRRLLLLSVSAVSLIVGFHLLFHLKEGLASSIFFLLAFLFFIRACLDIDELPKSALKEKKK